MIADVRRPSPPPYVICCGLVQVFQPLDEAWGATCDYCGRDFVYADDTLSDSDDLNRPDNGVIQ